MIEKKEQGQRKDDDGTKCYKRIKGRKTMEWRNNKEEGKEEANKKNNIEIKIEIDEIEEWCSMIKEERLGAKEGW